MRHGFRAEFRHPALGADPVVAWCRTVAAGAGAGRGVAFLPHVGDEVIVGFAGGDTADPILFGGLWSAADPPPDGAGDDGTHAIVTRSGIRIEFDDDRGSVTVETGGGRRIVLGDDAGECTIEDPHGNSIRLDAEGITIASGGGLDVSATGAIRIDGAAVSSNAPTATFGGTVTADTVAATNIVGENYTPGVGNVW